jgi:LEA14-like dessication related protein
MSRSIKVFLTISLLLFLNGCSTLSQVSKTKQALENCQFSLQSIEPNVDVQLNGFSTPTIKVKFNVVLGVKNTTDYNLAINKLDLKLYLDDLELAGATTNKFVKIPKGQSSTMALTMAIDPDVVSKKMVDRLQKGQVKYKAVAIFYFNVLGLDIPVRKTLSKDVI